MRATGWVARQEAEVTERFERSDERVEVRDGLALHVVRWQPVAALAAEPSFLLVHGLSSNARLWDGVGARLAAAGHLAVAVDQRGHGLSDKPDTGYDFATIDEDLILLIEKLGLDRPVVAGQSWGGGVALDLAVRYPDRIRAVVSVDGSAGDLQADFGSFDDCWERLAPPRVGGSPLDGVRRWFRMQHPDWSDEAIEGSLANFEHLPDGTVELWLTRDRHRQILRAMWDQQPASLWAQARVPVLAIVAETGDAAWTERKRTAMEAAERALTGSGIPHEIQYVHADHDVHAQHPELVAGAMLAALDGIFSAGAATGEPGAEPKSGAAEATNVTA